MDHLPQVPLYGGGGLGVRPSQAREKNISTPPEAQKAFNPLKWLYISLQTPLTPPPPLDFLQKNCIDYIGFSPLSFVSPRIGFTSLQKYFKI